MDPGWKIWLSCHLWKGRKPENERRALENQNMCRLGSRFLELYLLDSTSKTFLDSRFPYMAGSFPHTHQTEWSVEDITCIITKGILSLNFEETYLHKTSFLPKFAIYLHFFTTCTCSCYPTKSFSIPQCLKLMVIHSSKTNKISQKTSKIVS